MSVKSATLILFGATGDLAHRMLFPSLYNLLVDGLLPSPFNIVASGRTDMDDDAFRATIAEALNTYLPAEMCDEETIAAFLATIVYCPVSAGDEAQFAALARRVRSLGDGPIAVYLSTPPALFAPTAQGLAKTGLVTDSTRIAMEKPIGQDLPSSREVNDAIGALFAEGQIFRVDHYLGKETVQNLMVLRFGNRLFEPLWNATAIDHVQITVAETVGLEGRVSYYDGVGALRDMVQNHILQLLCMVAMEAPVSFEADEIRNKKSDVLNAIRKIKKEEVQQYAVRGQYSQGWVQGQQEKAYREEKGVAPDSSVETFAAVKFYIDNWRWQDVPFYVRTGKFLKEKTTLITVQFKEAPKYAFPPEASETWRSNRLTISIQPEMDIRLRFQAKRPGQTMSLNPVNMVFSYADSYDAPQPEAYETLLLDAMMGNPTQFMRGDQVEVAWEVIAPIQETWENRPPVDFPNYAPGTWGPEDAEALIAREGRNWITLPPKRKEG